MNEHMSHGSDDISALADGALQGEAFAAALDRLAGDAEARARWHSYHVVGDVLRCPDLATNCSADADFLARLEARLGQESRPAILQDALPEALPLAATAAAVPQRVAANADSFRWKMVAGFASVAAVAAVGWNVFAVSQAPSSGTTATFASAAPQQQQQPQQAPRTLVGLPAIPATEVATAQSPGTEAPVMIRNAQLDELLAAHNQAIGGAALQSQARFVRNANFQELPR